MYSSIYMSWNSSKLRKYFCEIRFLLILTIDIDSDNSMTSLIIKDNNIVIHQETITKKVSYLRNKNDKYSYEDTKLKINLVNCQGRKHNYILDKNS